MNETTTLNQTHDDPYRFFWYFIFVVIMTVSALPLFGLLRLPPLLPQIPLLLIHEFAAFAFVGHTLFSNIWAMRIRLTQGEQSGIWARGFLRKMALSITLPTSIIVPTAGLMLMEYMGGLEANPWAWDAYFAFWLMAGVSLVPDIIRYGRNRHSRDPKHGIVSGAIRGNIGTVLTFYIIYCMVAKDALIAG